MPGTEFTIDNIILLDSVPSNELQTVRTLECELNDIFLNKVKNIPCSRIVCSDLNTIRNTFKTILSKVISGKSLPIIHYEGHGSKEGLLLPSGETFLFEDLIDDLININIAMKNNLVVLFGGCETAYALMQTTITKACPFFLLFAPDKHVAASDFDCYVVFYRKLFSSGNLSEAINAFYANGPSSSYLAISSEDLFKRAALSYFNRHYFKDGPYEHYKQILEKADTKLSNIQEDIVAERIFQDQANELKPYFDTFMMLDLYPENKIRFKLDIDSLENLVLNNPTDK